MIFIYIEMPRYPLIYTFYIIVSPPSDECQLVYGIIDTGAYELRSKMDEREACTNKTISTHRFQYCFVCTCFSLPSSASTASATTNYCSNTLAAPRKRFFLISDDYIILWLPTYHLGWFFFGFFLLSAKK